MVAKFVLDQGRAELDWEALLFGSDGDPGMFSQPSVIAGANGSNKSKAKVNFGDTTLTFKSANGNLKIVDGALKKGTVTAIDLTSDDGKVFHLTGLNLKAAKVQALLDHGAENGRDAHFLAVFASTGTIFNGAETGPQTFFGSSGADIFNFTAADNQDDTNYVWTGGGKDVVHGTNHSFDFVDYGAATKGLTIDFAAGTVVDKQHRSYGTFDSKVDAVGGSDFNDTMSGNGKGNVIFGNGGKDTLIGKGGDDYFSPGKGNDSIDGGSGFNTLGYEHDGDATQGINLKYTAGTSHSGTATDDYGQTDTFSNIDSVLGSYLGDRMEGNDASNEFRSDMGDDTLIGGGGTDYLSGNRGNDVLTGGSGGDFFFFNVNDDGADTITDFASGEDHIQISDTDLESGVLASDQFLAQAGAEVAETESQTFIYNTTTGELFYDHDAVGGDGSVLIATLTGHPTLIFSDIQIG